MDTVTLIRQEGEQWRVWVCRQDQPLTLTPEEEKTLAYYVPRKSGKRAYNEAHPRHYIVASS